MSAKEKIAWLKGLLSGLEIEGKDVKVYGAVAEVLDALATQIEEQNEQIESLHRLYDGLEEECAALEEDITMLEDILDEFSKDEEEDDDGDGDNDDYATNYISVECPSCSSFFYYGQGEDEEEMLQCPNCAEKFSIGLAFINDDDKEEMDS